MEEGTRLSNHAEARRVTPTSAMKPMLYFHHPQIRSRGGGASGLAIYSRRTMEGQTSPLKWGRRYDVSFTGVCGSVPRRFVLGGPKLESTSSMKKLAHLWLKFWGNLMGTRRHNVFINKTNFYIEFQITLPAILFYLLCTTENRMLLIIVMGWASTNTY